MGPGDVAGKFELDFWGRCVDAATAANTQRHLVMPITCKEGEYPHNAYGDLEIYLVGSECVNSQRSDACLAYLIKPIQFKKTMEGFQDENLDQAAAVPHRESQQYRVKRQKILVKVEEKKAKLPSITHEVQYVDFTIDAPSAGCKDVVTYHFQMPPTSRKVHPTNVARANYMDICFLFVEAPFIQ